MSTNPTPTAYAPPLSEMVVDHIDAVCIAYCAATQARETNVGRAVASDGSFFARLRAGVVGIRVQTYDDVMGHFSFMWPSGVPWPEGVPRPAPKAIPERVTGKSKRARAEKEALHGQAA